jgi:hypothetical protein
MRFFSLLSIVWLFSLSATSLSFRSLSPSLSQISPSLSHHQTSPSLSHQISPSPSLSSSAFTPQLSADGRSVTIAKNTAEIPIGLYAMLFAQYNNSGPYETIAKEDIMAMLRQNVTTAISLHFSWAVSVESVRKMSPFHKGSESF